MARVLPKRMVRGEESERVGPGLVGSWEAYGWEWQDLIPVLKSTGCQCREWIIGGGEK